MTNKESKKRRGKDGVEIKVPDIEYEHYGSQTSQISSMISLDMSLITLANQDTAIVANLAAERPLDILTMLENRVLGADRNKPQIMPGALFVIFPKDMDSTEPSNKQIKEENIDQEAWPQKWAQIEERLYQRTLPYPVYLSFETEQTNQWHDELIEQANKLLAKKTEKNIEDNEEYLEVVLEELKAQPVSGINRLFGTGNVMPLPEPLDSEQFVVNLKSPSDSDLKPIEEM